MQTTQVLSRRTVKNSAKTGKVSREEARKAAKKVAAKKLKSRK